MNKSNIVVWVQGCTRWKIKVDTRKNKHIDNGAQKDNSITAHNWGFWAEQTENEAA